MHVAQSNLSESTIEGSIKESLYQQATFSFAEQPYGNANHQLQNESYVFQ